VVVDGVSIQENLPGWQANIGYVPQSIFLMDDTLRRNVAFGIEDKKIDDSRVREVLHQAQLEEFMKSRPEKLETLVGERGVRLSGGQRQRIALARAFVRQAPILILDEATASLDSKTEAQVQGAIDRLEEGRTVICVAHRLSTLRGMDKIIVLDDGRVTEEGSFNELLEHNGAFAAMARKQGISETVG
jgi:ATP-binding cassette subfamily C protein